MKRMLPVSYVSVFTKHPTLFAIKKRKKEKNKNRERETDILTEHYVPLKTFWTSVNTIRRNSYIRHTVVF